MAAILSRNSSVRHVNVTSQLENQIPVLLCGVCIFPSHLPGWLTSNSKLITVVSMWLLVFLWFFCLFYLCSSVMSWTKHETVRFLESAGWFTVFGVVTCPVLSSHAYFQNIWTVYTWKRIKLRFWWQGPDKWTEKKEKYLRGQWKASKFKWIISPLPFLLLQCLPLSDAPVLQNKNDNTFQETHRHTHNHCTSLGSVRGCYWPYFVTDFTHVWNHKIRVSHLSGQTQAFPLHLLHLSVRPLSPEPDPFTGCSASTRAAFTNCQDPILSPPPTHSHTH